MKNIKITNIEKPVFDNKTSLQVSPVYSTCYPVKILNYSEIHFYNFEKIKNENSLENILNNYLVYYAPVFKQKTDEPDKDFKIRLYHYSEKLESEYMAWISRGVNLVSSVNILEDNLVSLNGSNLKDEFLTSDMKLIKMDFDKGIKLNGNYYQVDEKIFDSLGLNNKQISEYILDMVTTYYLKKMGVKYTPEYVIEKKIKKINVQELKGNIDVVINGKKNKVVISDRESHYYDFKDIREKKIFKFLKNNFKDLYSRIFEKFQDESDSDFLVRVNLYYSKFECEYKNYLEMLKKNNVSKKVTT